MSARSSLRSRGVGLLLVAVGAGVALAAADVVTVGEVPVQVPRWAVAACGALFVLAGAGALVPRSSHVGRVVSRAANEVAVLGFGLTCAWVAVTGPGARSGLPFVPDAVGEAGARGLSGLVALACGVVVVRGARRLLRSSSGPPAGRGDAG